MRVYRFPVFERGFCEELVEELEHFERSSAPKGRPNTMNHYGVMHVLLLAETPVKHHLIAAPSFIFHHFDILNPGPTNHEICGSSGRVHAGTLIDYQTKSGKVKGHFTLVSLKMHCLMWLWAKMEP